jgi:hypothetical protein
MGEDPLRPGRSLLIARIDAEDQDRPGRADEPDGPTEILSLKGDSYRLRGKDLDARPARLADLG